MITGSVFQRAWGFASNLCFLVLVVALSSCSNMEHASASPSKPEYRHLAVPSGEELDYLRYPSKGNGLLVWVSSERGQAEAERAAAIELARRGIEVWMLDLSFSYFLDADRKGIDKIPAADMQALLKLAEQHKTPIVFAVGRAAVPMLKAFGSWASDEGRPEHQRYVLMHPNLYENAEALEDARYLSLGNLKGAQLLILQPRRSVGVMWLDQQSKALRGQGAAVKNEILEQLREGYWARQEPTEHETEMSRHLADLIWDQLFMEKEW
jgi:hypothetical protein